MEGGSKELLELLILKCYSKMNTIFIYGMRKVWVLGCGSKALNSAISLGSLMAFISHSIKVQLH